MQPRQLIPILYHTYALTRPLRFVARPGAYASESSARLTYPSRSISRPTYESVSRIRPVR